MTTFHSILSSRPQPCADIRMYRILSIADGHTSSASTASTASYVDELMMDNDPNVRWKVARDDFTPTDEQIRLGLCDIEPFVRHAWIEREDFNASTEQIDYGLKNESDFVRFAWKQKLQALIDSALTSREDIESSL